MLLPFSPYTAQWVSHFDDIRQEIALILFSFAPKIEHIGSTSVEGLSAKPIIDILVVLNDEHQLNDVVSCMLEGGFLYYPKYNMDMPYRRFFVRLKSNAEGLKFPSVFEECDKAPEALEPFKSANIHVLLFQSHHWIRHIAFRDYLRTHPEIKQQYQLLKEQLIVQQWVDSNAYNKAKEPFILKHEEKALKWYNEH